MVRLGWRSIHSLRGWWGLGTVPADKQCLGIQSATGDYWTNSVNCIWSYAACLWAFLHAYSVAWLGVSLMMWSEWTKDCHWIRPTFGSAADELWTNFYAVPLLTFPLGCLRLLQASSDKLSCWVPSFLLQHCLYICKWLATLWRSSHCLTGKTGCAFSLLCCWPCLQPCARRSA